MPFSPQTCKYVSAFQTSPLGLLYIYRMYDLDEFLGTPEGWVSKMADRLVDLDSLNQINANDRKAYNLAMESIAIAKKLGLDVTTPITKRDLLQQVLGEMVDQGKLEPQFQFQTK